MKSALGALAVLALVFVPFAVRGDEQIVFIPAATGGGGGGGSVTFPLLAPAGTAAAASYSFTGDPNSGLFARVPNTVSLAANGANMLEADQFAVTVNGGLTVGGAATAAGLTLSPGNTTLTWISRASIASASGSPEGAVALPVGSLFLRTDGGAGTTLYVKQSGAATNTGWVAVIP